IKLLRDRVGMPNLMIDAIPNDPEWDFPSLSPLLNEIRRERRVELLAEGFRWDDIARWAAADEVIVGQRPKGFKAAQIDRNPLHGDESGGMDRFQRALADWYGFRLNMEYLDPLPESQSVLSRENSTRDPGW